MLRAIVAGLIYTVSLTVCLYPLRRSSSPNSNPQWKSAIVITALECWMDTEIKIMVQETKKREENVALPFTRDYLWPCIANVWHMCGNFNRHDKPIESLSYVYPLAVFVSNRLLQMILVHFGIDAVVEFLFILLDSFKISSNTYTLLYKAFESSAWSLERCQFAMFSSNRIKCVLNLVLDKRMRTQIFIFDTVHSSDAVNKSTNY